MTASGTPASAATTTAAPVNMAVTDYSSQTAKQLQARVEELMATNQELQNQLQLAASREGEALPSNQLIQVVWLERNIRLQDQRVLGVSRNGVPFLRFTGTYSSTSREDPSVHYPGAPRAYVARGAEVVQTLIDAIHAGERRVRVQAFESPWRDGSGQSDWVVVNAEVLPRQANARPGAGGGERTGSMAAALKAAGVNLPTSGSSGSAAAAPAQQLPSDIEAFLQQRDGGQAVPVGTDDSEASHEPAAQDDDGHFDTPSGDEG